MTERPPINQEDLDLLLQLEITYRMIEALQPGSEMYETYLQNSYDLTVLLLKRYYGNIQPSDTE